MIHNIIEKINGASLDLIDSLADKLGLSSIVTSVGITTIVQGGPNVPWAFTDYVLLISAISGILFIIEKIIVIYIRIRQATILESKEAQKKKSRGLPK